MKEQGLDAHNAFGKSDPTPEGAVKEIMDYQTKQLSHANNKHDTNIRVVENNGVYGKLSYLDLKDGKEDWNERSL